MTTPCQATAGDATEANPFDILRETIGPHLDALSDEQLIELYGPGILGLPDDE